jgi:phosphatidylglycerophosphate synthase
LWLSLPNMLSLSRVIFLPLLFYLLYSGSHYLFLAAYILIGSTDCLDGLLARKLNQVTETGKILDSGADFFFYVASAYFLYYLFPDVILANQNYLIAFFSLLGLSFIISLYLFKKVILMHTRLLRVSAVMVYLVVIASFWLDTVYFVRVIIISYFLGFCEEILIFLFFGNVDPDTKSIFALIGDGKSKTI